MMPKIKIFTSRIITILLSVIALLWFATLQPPPINVTKAQYETALARWNNRHVSDYVETISYWDRGALMDKYKISVHVDYVDGKAIESVKQVERLDKPEIIDNVERWNSDMVSASFQHVKNLVESPSPSWRDEWGYFLQFSIQFDPTIGYPRVYTVYRDHVLDYEEVREDLKVIR